MRNDEPFVQESLLSDPLDLRTADPAGDSLQKAGPALESLQEPEDQPAPKKLHFSAAQQAVIDSREKNLLVSASAGAGKTAVLVERLCQLVIKDRIPISGILAMTFTEDAAREMKTRLKLRLGEMAGDPWIDRQISQLETA